MASRIASDAPMTALVLTARSDLAPLATLLSSSGIITELAGAEPDDAAPAPALAVVDGERPSDAARRIRALRSSGARIVALTPRGEPAALGAFYRAGADVVFSEDVDPEHLFLQCCALLQVWQPETRPARVGAAWFEPGLRRLLVGDHAVRLTEVESQILGLLVEGRAGFVSRDAISRTVFGIPYDRFDRRIDVHVSNLRRKMRDGRVDAVIETSRLNGFRLAEPQSPAPRREAPVPA